MQGSRIENILDQDFEVTQMSGELGNWGKGMRKVGMEKYKMVSSESDNSLV